jgi:hypothetical protein
MFGAPSVSIPIYMYVFWVASSIMYFVASFKLVPESYYNLVPESYYNILAFVTLVVVSFGSYQAWRDGII